MPTYEAIQNGYPTSLYSEKKKRKARSSEAPKGCDWPGLGRNIFPLEPQQELVAGINLISMIPSSTDRAPQTIILMTPALLLRFRPRLNFPHHHRIISTSTSKNRIFTPSVSPQPHILSNSLTNPPPLVFVLESATPPTSPPSSYYPRLVVVPS